MRDWDTAEMGEKKVRTNVYAIVVESFLSFFF